MSFWVRPDSLETLLVAIGIAGAASPLCLGLCIGFAVNLKVHAFVYFLPLVFELWLARGWRVLPLLVLTAGATFFLPFLLPSVSLHEYVVGLAQQADGRRPAMEMLPKVLTFFVPLALPVALPLARRGSPGRDRRFALAALTTLLILLYPASILGAGAYHFLPLVPVLAEARRRLPIVSTGAMFAPFLLLIAASLVMQGNLDNLRQRDGWDRLANEAVELARQSPVQPVNVGYGDSGRSYEIAQLSKADLALHGYPARIDAQVLMELVQTGIEASRRLTPIVANCEVARWLLPRDEEPFAVRDVYYGNRIPLFGTEFRKAFADHYRLVGTSAHFAIWECRH